MRAKNLNNDNALSVTVAGLTMYMISFGSERESHSPCRHRDWVAMKLELSQNSDLKHLEWLMTMPPLQLVTFISVPSHRANVRTHNTQQHRLTFNSKESLSFLLKQQQQQHQQMRASIDQRNDVGGIVACWFDVVVYYCCCFCGCSRWCCCLLCENAVMVCWLHLDNNCHLAEHQVKIIVAKRSIHSLSDLNNLITLLRQERGRDQSISKLNELM